MSDIKSALFNVFSNVFGCDFKELDMDTAAGKLPRWDSMGHVLLLGEIERQFNVSLTPDEMTQMVTIRKIIDVLTNKTVLKPDERFS